MIGSVCRIVRIWFYHS